MTVLLLDCLGVVTYDPGVITWNTSIHSLECLKDISKFISTLKAVTSARRSDAVERPKLGKISAIYKCFVMAEASIMYTFVDTHSKVKENPPGRLPLLSATCDLVSVRPIPSLLYPFQYLCFFLRIVLENIILQKQSGGPISFCTRSSKGSHPSRTVCLERRSICTSQVSLSISVTSSIRCPN